MGRSKIVFKLSCLVVFWLSQHGADAGEIYTQPSRSTGDLKTTNWGPGTNGITDPLSFHQFDPRLGTLDHIEVTLSTTIRNDYTLTFPGTRTPTTLYVATTATRDASILTDPEKLAQLTDGPTVYLYAPDGKTPILLTTQQVDLVHRTEPSGTWQSLDPNAPNFIEPTMTSQSLTRRLDASNGAWLLPDFIGTGNVDLPVTAKAFSSYYSSTGNGSGGVRTYANASVTIDYLYSVVPEPTSAILAILGIGTSLLACQLRRRAVQRCRGKSDRGRTGSDIHHV